MKLTPEWSAFLSIFDRLDARWQTEEDTAEPERKGLGWEPCIVEIPETQPKPVEPDFIDWIVGAESESADDGLSL